MTIMDRLNNLTVYLCGKPFKVECKPGIGKAEHFIGACDVFGETIQIEGNASDYDKVSTVLHEIIDATDRRFELEIAHGKLCVLESVLMAALSSSPDLLDIIKEIGQQRNESPLSKVFCAKPEIIPIEPRVRSSLG